MPYRVAGLMLVIFGVVTVVGLVLVGVDVYKSSRTGPNWKRRLLVAGLAALGLIGAWFSRPRPPVITCYAPIPVECALGYTLKQQLPLLERMVAAEKLDPVVARKVLLKAEQDLNRISDPRLQMPGREHAELEEVRRAAAPVIKRLRERLGDDPKLLENSADWKKLVEAWRVIGKSRDLKEKGRAFDDADGALRKLTDAGLLTEQESKLLGIDLESHRRDYLIAGTCYDSVGLLPSEKSLERLTKRLPLLSELAAGGKVHPRALSKVVAAVESDLESLTNPKLNTLRGQEARRAKQLSKRVREQVAKLKVLMTERQTGPLGQSPLWKKITEAWRFCTPLAKSGRSTTKQRKEADARLKGARAATGELAKKGLLSAAEVGLLCAEIDRIRKDLYRNPPTDTQIECYKMAVIAPAKKSFERLKKRLPLLEKLVAGGKVNPAVAYKVLGSVEKDVAVLSDEKQAARLGKDERAKAEAVRDAVKAELAKLKALAKTDD